MMRWLLSLCTPEKQQTLEPLQLYEARVTMQSSDHSDARKQNHIIIEKEVLVTEIESVDGGDEDHDEAEQPILSRNVWAEKNVAKQPTLSKRATLPLKTKARQVTSADRSNREKDDELHRRELARRNVNRAQTLAERKTLQEAEQTRKARWEEVHGTL